MSKIEKTLVIILCLLSILLGFLIGAAIYEKPENFDKGHKAGQIDALNGIQNWDKVIKSDTVYFKIK